MKPYQAAKHGNLTRFERPGQPVGWLRLMLPLSLLLLLLLLPASGQAQESTITATVNKTRFSTDELIILTVTIIDDSAQQPLPILPELNGLTVVDLDLNTEVSLINGKIFTAVTYTYRLQARQTGILTIPPVAVKIDGNLLKAAPISITVNPGTAPLPAAGNAAVVPADISPPAGLQGQDFFVEALVDIPDPYLGQQVIHTFRFYQAIRLYKEPSYDEPLFNNFDATSLPIRQYNWDSAGRTYLISEIRTILFPKISGMITIRPSRLVLLGNLYEEPEELSTDPVRLEVRALPLDAPAGFQGAVGQYEVEAWFSPHVAVVNQTARYHVAVTGRGNISALPEPTWPQLAGWRDFNTLSSLTTTIEDSHLSGTRVFERLILPEKVGPFTLPPATFTYFDPLAAVYRTVSTDPIAVQVVPPPTPGPVTATAMAALPTASPVPLAAASANEAARPENDRAGLTLADLSPTSIPLPVFAAFLLGLCNLLPLAALAGAAGLWFWQKRRGTGPALPQIEPLELDQAKQQLHPVLAEVMSANDDNYKVVSRALYRYLDTKLAIPGQRLSRSELSQRLEQIRLAPILRQTIDEMLTECEQSRFGPLAPDNGWALLRSVDELLFTLDQALRAEEDVRDKPTPAG